MTAVPQIVSALRAQTVATLTAAVVASIGKPVSIETVMGISNDIYFAMYPEPSLGAYKEWAKTKDERLKKVHT